MNYKILHNCLRFGHTALLCGALLCLPSIVFGGVADTKHNLSVTGPGRIAATNETGICIFCHAPSEPTSMIKSRWNRKETVVSYKPYESTTMQANVGQPTGSSRVCLSCHDGTIALGALESSRQEVVFRGGIRFMPPDSPSNLGTDLSDDHPISFTYDTRLAVDNAELVDPATLPREIKLDKGRQLQCTACHNPHNNSYGKFLVMPNQYSKLCTSCHHKRAWDSSSHAMSMSRWNGAGASPWSADSKYSTVAENGCGNCHVSHGAKIHERLLARPFEEDNCLVCHNGNVASKNIENELTKPFGHFVQNYSGIHDAAEDFSGRLVTKHVECVDCHNPHQSNGERAVDASSVSGSIRGGSGINITGQAVADAKRAYEICFKCHSDNNVISKLAITRQIGSGNVRLEFDPANPSFHPVADVGTSPDVPSLIAPYTTNSMISCMDCHNSDDASRIRGPHGSNFKYLLEKKYETADYTEESLENYALCYKCHSRDSILGDNSFQFHRKHVVEHRAPCSACHSAHGVSIQQGGSPNNNSHLMNFDLTIVSKNSLGEQVRFEDSGRFAGKCYLKCHDVSHEPSSNSLANGARSGRYNKN